MSRPPDGLEARLARTEARLAAAAARVRELEAALAAALPGRSPEAPLANWAVETMAQGLTLVGVEGRFEYVNPAFARMLGYPAGDLLGRSPIELTSPDARAQLTREGMRREEGQTTAYESRLLRADGTTVPVLVTGAPRFHDGEWAGSIAVITDLTAQKVAELALQESERRLRLVVDTALDAFIQMDARGRITGWNPQAERIFGWSREEVLERRLSDIIVPERLRASHEQGLARYLRSGEARVLDRRIEIDALHRNGHEFPVELSISPIRLGDALSFSGFVRDITERRAAEEALLVAKEAAESATRAKSEFVANMSHEIRTPLNAVIGASGLLLDARLSASQRELVDLIRRGGDTLLSLINDILDFSKVESGELVLDLHPFDLRGQIEESLDLVATAATARGLTLDYQCPATVPPALVADSTRLKQVLVNLLSNAVKFTAEGGVRVEVSAEPAGNGYLLHFEVRDSGIGIPADRIPHLFEPFRQVDASTSRRFGGTGLGLAICRRLVTLMGGRIWVESRPGEGSAFHFTLLAAPVVGSQADEVVVPELVGRHILVAAADPDLRERLHRQLAAWGMIVRAAPTSSAAAVQLAQTPAELVLVEASLAAAPESAVLRETPLLILGMGGEARQGTGRLGRAYMPLPLRVNRLYRVLLGLLGPTGPGRDAGTAPAPEMIPDPHLRILLAEDVAVNQRVLLGMLEQLGYRADVAANGLEVLDAVARHPYQVILMDVQMPEMDGYEATRLLRDRLPAAQQPQIVALTAHALDGDREACLAAGMDDYLSKPVRREALADALRRAAAARLPAPIDRAELERLYGDAAAAMLPDLVTLFVDEMTPAVAALRPAAAEGDEPRLHAQAHALKGAAGTCGALPLAALCRTLEASLRQGEPVDVVIGAVEREFGRVRAFAHQIGSTGHSH